MPLLNCLRDTGHGTVFKCCISQESLNLVGYYFVNDYIIINISPSPNTPNTYTLKLYQEELYLYSGPAQAMGGKFSATKTKWNLLEFKWDKAGIWRLAENEAGLFSESCRIKENRTTYHFWSIKTSRSLDSPKWTLDRKNESTESNNILMVR